MELRMQRDKAVKELILKNKDEIMKQATESAKKGNKECSISCELFRTRGTFLTINNCFHFFYNPYLFMSANVTKKEDLPCLTVIITSSSAIESINKQLQIKQRKAKLHTKLTKKGNMTKVLPIF